MRKQLTGVQPFKGDQRTGGRLMVPVTASIHRELKSQAAKHGIPLMKLADVVIADGLKRFTT